MPPMDDFEEDDDLPPMPKKGRSPPPKPGRKPNREMEGGVSGDEEEAPKPRRCRRSRNRD